MSLMPARASAEIAPPYLLGALGAAAVVAFLISLAVGPSGFGFGHGAGLGGEAGSLIFWEIRLPRAILGALVGGALGLSGAALQGYLRNPLAEPSLVGVSGGAALGAVLAIHLGWSQALALALPAGGLIGAAVAMLAVVALAGAHGGPVTLILAGLAVSGIATALISLALNLSQNPFASVEMVFWLMGSLADRSFEEVKMALPFILVGCGLLLTTGRALDALTLGDVGARSLGISMSVTRWTIAVGVGLAAGASVAVTGVIGFVGLVTPHLLRPLVGARPGALLVPSILGGAVIVLAGDVLVRLIPAAGEVKLGVAMAALGAPFFLVLLLRLRRKIA